MKKKSVHKVARKTGKSKKVIWWKKLPILSSLVGSAALFFLTFLYILGAHTSVLGASAVQVDLQILSKNGPVTFATGQGIQIQISETKVPKGSKQMKPLYYTVTSVPNLGFTYSFSAENGAGYNVWVIPTSRSGYTVLNRYKRVEVKNGKSPCTQGDHNPCKFFIAKERAKSVQEATPTPKPTCSIAGGTCVSIGQFKGEQMIRVNGTCKPGLICAK